MRSCEVMRQGKKFYFHYQNAYGNEGGDIQQGAPNHIFA